MAEEVQRIPQDHFDVVLLGTSLSNSVLGAALQRSGYSVLTLDSNTYYGSDFPTFTLDELQSFLLPPEDKTLDTLCQEQAHPPRKPDPVEDEEWRAELERLQRQQDALAEELASDAPTRKKQEREERLLKAISGAKSTTRFEVPRRGPEVHAPALRSAAVYIPHPESKAMDDVTKKARRFCLDLQPKLLLSRGSAVPLLVESGTASYLEFQAVNPLFIQVQDKGHPVQVPLSKSQVFQSPVMSGAEKRNLMRLLQLILGDQHASEASPQVAQSQEDTTFVEFLEGRGFSDQVIQTLVSGMLLVSAPFTTSEIKNLSTAQGIEYSRIFLQSVGRYGPGAFLYPNYGIGDIAQSFNRSCAVHDGTFVLRELPKAFALAEDGTCTGLVTSWGQFIHADLVVSTLDYLPAELLPLPDRVVQQDTAIVISTSPISVDGRPWKESCVGAISSGSLGNPDPVRVLQLSHTHRVCPPGYYVTYLETSRSIAKEEVPGVALAAAPLSKPPRSHALWSCVEHLFSRSELQADGQEEKEAEVSSSSDSRPALVWSCFYSQCFPEISTALVPVQGSPNWFASNRQHHSATLDAGVAQLEAAYEEILRARATRLQQEPPTPNFFDAAEKIVVDEDERDPGFMDGLDEDDLADILSDSSSDDETPEGQTKEASE